MSKKPVRVVILGAGYAAIRVIMSLRKAIYDGEVEALIINRNNHHTFHGFVSEMLTGRISPHMITSPSRRIFKPAKLMLGEIEDIDLAGKTVTVSRDMDRKFFKVPYDHLVISVGSVTAHVPLSGMDKHGFDLKTYETCLRLRNHLMRIVEIAANEPDEEERRRLLTFVVIGGGYAGSEVSGELTDFQSIIRTSILKHISPEDFRVILIHSGEQILPDYARGPGANGYGNGHPKQVAYAAGYLEKNLGVNILRNHRVEAITPEEVILDDGQRIPTRTAIPTVGIKTPPLVQLLPFEREPTRGRIITEQTLRVPGQTNVWAVGDCAAVPHPVAGVCPPVGVYATFGGEELGRNILRQERGEPLVDFVHPGIGQAVSLGRRTVAGEIWGLYTRGFLGWLIAWRAGLIYFIPTWDRKLRLLADWLIWPFVGRDLVGARDKRPSDFTIHRLHLEPGDVICQRGQRLPYCYVILDGEVIKECANGQTVALHRGDSFGFGDSPQPSAETFTAKTVVKLARMRQPDAKQLKQVAKNLQVQPLTETILVEAPTL